MNPLRLIRNGLRFHWRTHLSVLPGILLATAVLTGALLTGDSVKGSLRRFALQRLGGIRQALFTPSRFFSQDLAARISGDTAAVLLLKGMAITEEKQINRVQVLGCGPAFWNFAGLDFDLQPNETALGWRLGLRLGTDALLGRAALLEVAPAGDWRAQVMRGAQADFPLKPADLMPQLMGPSLGAALAAAQREWLAQDLRPDRAQLLAFLGLA